MRPLIRALAITIIMAFVHSTALGQLYPSPNPVSPAQETTLLASLKISKPDRYKVVLLLSLSNLNINKPLRTKADLDRAMNFAAAASTLSSNLNDESGYNDAMLQIADIFTLRDDMESAEKILPTLNDVSRIKLYLNLSYRYIQRETGKKDNDWQKALFYAGEARISSIYHHLPEYEILALNDIAMVHADQRKPVAEKEYLEVINRYKAIDYAKLHYVYNNLAVWYLTNGNNDKALYYSMEAVKSMKATRDTIAAGDIYIIQSVIQIDNENYQQTFDMAVLAINSMKIHTGKYGLTDHEVLNMPVRALRKMKKYEQALHYARKIQKDYPPVTYADKIDDAKMIGNIYRDMKMYGSAEKYFLKAVNLSKNLSKNQSESTALLYKDVGQLYVESRLYAKAKPYLEVASKGLDGKMTSAVNSHLNFLLFLTDSAMGDYRSAIKHLSNFRGMEEFNLRQEQNKEVKRLEVEYRTKEKESALKIKDQNIELLQQNSKLQEIRLKQFNFTKNLITVGIVALSAFTVLLYRQYRHKQKANREIMKKSELIEHTSEVIMRKNEIITQKNEQLEFLLNEKEWLLKEVHHRVKNNLHTVICLLESQAAYLENDALKAIEKSQNRIYTMSLIHQKLYQSEDIKTINMANYIPELVQYLKESFDISDGIYFNLSIDQISLDASQAIP